MAISCVGALFIPIILEFVMPITVLNLYSQTYKAVEKFEE